MGLSVIRHGCLRYYSGLRLHPSGAGFVMYGMIFWASAKAPLGVCHFYNFIKLGGHRGVYLIFSQPCDTVRAECDRKRCLNNFKLTDLDKNIFRISNSISFYCHSTKRGWWVTCVLLVFVGLRLSG